MGTYICATLLAVLSVTTAAQPSRDARRAFESSFKNRQVVLKQTLYSIAAPFSIGGPARVMTRGTLILTPDKGAYHSGFFGNKNVRDRDPQQLLAKGAAETQLISATGPKLLKYEPGAKMRMTVSLQDDVVRALLYDELATGDDEPATSIEIQWPQKFSRTFTERAPVEALLADYLQF